MAAYAIAKLIGPRSYNPVKGEPFECGIPTYGTSWLPVHIGYYLFAILFLMFDVETVFLYPWAVVVKTFGPLALATIGFFMLVLSIWPCIRFGGKEHSNGNKKAKIKSLPYNEWKDNDTLSKMASELNEGGTNLVLGNLDQLINWGRSNSLWSLTFATSCCGIELWQSVVHVTTSLVLD